MSYEVPTCWTELSVRRRIISASGYDRTFAINRRSSIEVSNPQGTQITTFRIVTRAVGKEAEDPGLTPSEKCKVKLRRVRRSLDLSITYWVEQSPTEKVSRELLPISIRDNFEEVHNCIRSKKGLKPEHYLCHTTKVPIENTASMKTSTVEKIIAYAKRVHSDKTRKDEILTFYRAGVLVPEDAYFHWFKIVEILRLKSWKVLRTNNKLWVSIIANVDTGFLGGFPQFSRHNKDSKYVEMNMLPKWNTMIYKDHLRPIIEHYIENC